VWEPLMDVTKTLRTGGEGLGVAPTTVDSDQAVSDCQPMFSPY
jgi:nuclear-control-of-ATPase protein 2